MWLLCTSKDKNPHHWPHIWKPVISLIIYYYYILSVLITLSTLLIRPHLTVLITLLMWTAHWVAQFLSICLPPKTKAKTPLNPDLWLTHPTSIKNLPWIPLKRQVLLREAYCHLLLPSWKALWNAVWRLRMSPECLVYGTPLMISWNRNLPKNPSSLRKINSGKCVFTMQIEKDRDQKRQQELHLR